MFDSGIFNGLLYGLMGIFILLRVLIRVGLEYYFLSFGWLLLRMLIFFIVVSGKKVVLVELNLVERRKGLSDFIIFLYLF